MTAAISQGRDERGGCLAAAVFLLDSWLQRRHGVFEYSAEPDCLFRVQRATGDCRTVLSDGTMILPGDPILVLHVWNEHVPAMSAGGPDLGWARRLGMAIDRSLFLLQRHLQENSAAHKGVAAICADMSFGPASRNDRLTRLSSRFGFEPVTYTANHSGRIKHLGENILMLLLVTASNPPAARFSVLRREPTLAYLSRRRLERRYGTRSSREEVDADR